jgi:hypothetical protein
MYLTVQIEEDNDMDSAAVGHTSVLARQFPCQCYQLEFTRHYELLDLLEAQPRTPSTESALYKAMELFQEHGWKASWPSGGNVRYFHSKETDSVSPVLQSPGIHYHRIYNMLAIDGHALELFVCTGGGGGEDKPFRLMDAVEAYCQCYGVDPSKTFPSHANLVCNRVVGRAGLGTARHPARAGPYVTAQHIFTSNNNNSNEAPVMGTRSEGKVCLIDAPNEPFIYDNMVLHADGSNDEDNVDDTSTPISTIKEPQSKEKKRRENNAKLVDLKTLESYRLIPVALLPLFLPFLPPCYTRVNTVLHECELLESRIWNCFTDIANYQSYLTEQVEALARNRRFLGFTYQCSHHASFTQDPQQRLLNQYERSLYENEILQLRMALVATKECTEKEFKRLRKRHGECDVKK